MSLSKHKYIPSYDFPEELLSEIFKRLPVKNLLPILILSIYFLEDKSIHEFTVRSDDSQCRKYCTFDYPLDLPACSWYAQSNGLICLSNMFGYEPDYNPDIYLWNPLVQKYKTVPDSTRSTLTYKEVNWNALAFGYLPEVDDYVVVHIVKPRSTSEPKDSFMGPDAHLDYEKYLHSIIICVYSLSTNSWKEIRQDKVLVDYMSSNHSVFVNGTAFWVGCDLLFQLVMSFDTKTNVLQKFKVPDYMAPCERQLDNPLILPFGHSFGYFVEVDEFDRVDVDEDEHDGSPQLDIWVLKDGMSMENDMWGTCSWKKKMSVGLSENVWADVLGIRNNGEPIQAKSDKLISYDLDTHEPYDFVESCDHLTPSSYYENGFKAPFVIRPFVETLVFHDID
ncbi:hypothetical protein POM88_037901 [Heracleum sosnowskyi]|uniref:F-box associated beta-propeller type 1 domain-containing protein n=1 Tax=Heracleum sosnowskyi TaxID=360622 RepID=A0AAD8MGC7_9APIA|nr:hypothetical protein POM88_037901 [Heracleum sosnowskyi]